MSEVGQVRATFRPCRATFGYFCKTKHKKDTKLPQKGENDQKYQRGHILEDLNQDV